MGYYNSERIPEEDRRNTAFALVAALRETFSLAKRTQQPVTYEDTIDMLFDLDPAIYRYVTQLLAQKNESETVKYYKQKSEAKSIGFFQYAPETLIEEDIVEHENLLSKANAENYKALERRMVEMKAALEYFKPRRVSEHKILQRDFNLSLQNQFFERKLYDDEFFKDYKLNDNRVLRVRLLHPDQEEHIIGTDLVYEYFDLLRNEVRFVHLQYKTWDESVLYLKQGNIADQLNKLASALCRSGLCTDHNGERSSKGYRMPYCSAFIRPTNKIQHMNSNLQSTGLHVPVCEALSLLDAEGKLTRKNIAGNCLSGHIFMDMLIGNLLGSRWIPISSLEKFYEEKGVLSHVNMVRVHAQEIQLHSE